MRKVYSGVGGIIATILLLCAAAYAQTAATTADPTSDPVFMQGSASAGASGTGDGTAIICRGYNGIGFQVKGTFTGTLTPRITQALPTDTSPGWNGVQVLNIRSGAVSTTITAAGYYAAANPGAEMFQVQITSLSSGSVTVTGRNTNSSGIDAALGSGGGGGGGSVTQGSVPWEEDLQSVGGTAIGLGQTTMANSLPVVPASDFVGKSRITPWFAGFTTDFDSTITSLPATSTSLTATTTVVLNLHINNTDSAAHTVTVTDTAGHEYLSAFSIPANSNLVLQWGPKGLKMVGIKWSADQASKVNAQLSGLQ